MADAALNRLKCSVCLNTYDVPKTLPCLHTFCKNCIEECILKRPSAIAEELAENEMRCPNCRQKHTLPPGGVEDIPINFEIRAIIELLQSVPSSPTHPASQASNCKECTKKNVECFCEDCRVLVCALCALENHNKHTVKRMEVACQKHRDALDETIGDVVACCLEVNNALTKNKEVLDTLRHDAGNCSKTIKAVFDSLRAHLDNREGALLTAIEKVEQGKSTLLNNQREKLNGLKTELNDLIGEAMQLLSEKEVSHFFAHKDKLNDRLVKKVEDICEIQLGPCCDHFIEQHCLPVDVANLTHAIKHFGSVYCEISPEHCTAEGKGLLETLVDNESHFTVTLRDMYGNAGCEEMAEVLVNISPERKPAIYHAQLNAEPDGTYKVKYTVTERDVIIINITVNGTHIKNSPFKVIPSTHNFEKGIEFWEVTSDIHEAGGCAIGIHGEVIVIDTQRCCVMVFDSKFELVKKFGTKGNGKGCFNSPKGVTVDSRNTLFIADTGNNRIVVTSIDGESFRSFGSYGADRKEFVLPTDVALGFNKDHHQLILVADTYNHRVQVLNHIGLYITRFGSEGNSHGNFKVPQGITTNNEGLVFVCDTGNKRIQVFSNEWKFLHIFNELTHGGLSIAKPFRITCTEDNFVLVADQSGVVIANFRGDLVTIIQDRKPIAICCTRIKERGTFLAICETKHAYLGQPN